MELKLGSILKKLRNEKGVTQEEVADYAEVLFQAVSKWETDTTLPDITLLPNLATFFGVKIDDLFSVNVDDEMTRIDYMLENTKLTDKNFTYAKRTLDAALLNDTADVEIIKRYARLLLKKTVRTVLRLEACLKGQWNLRLQIRRYLFCTDRQEVETATQWIAATIGLFVCVSRMQSCTRCLLRQ